jgi:hypothetical protein
MNVHLKFPLYVSQFGDGNLSLKFLIASSPIELRGLAEQLRSKIAKADFSDPNKANVYEPIVQLLNLSGDSREWSYLNNGTHEENDRAEFARQTVALIIRSLEQIDAAPQ